MKAGVVTSVAALFKFKPQPQESILNLILKLRFEFEVTSAFRQIPF